MFWHTVKSIQTLQFRLPERLLLLAQHFVSVSGGRCVYVYVCVCGLYSNITCMPTPHASETMGMQYKHAFQTQTSSQCGINEWCKASEMVQSFSGFS